MKKTLAILALTFVIALGAASPALAATGLEFGAHHADMAQQGTIGADMNPGMHTGYAGWMAH